MCFKYSLKQRELQIAICTLELDGSRCGVRLSHHPAALAVFRAQLLSRGTLQSAELPHNPQEIATTKGTLGEHSLMNFSSGQCEAALKKAADLLFFLASGSDPCGSSGQVSRTVQRLC